MCVDAATDQLVALASQSAAHRSRICGPETVHTHAMSAHPAYNPAPRQSLDESEP